LQKFFYFCVGKRINVDNLPKFRFVKILEYNDEETHEWIPTFNIGFEDEYSHEEMVELVPELKDMDLKAIWISPMIPLMVVFLGGLLSSALFGNLFFRFLELFF
ncbi:MAG: A24 family peptidase C-terminal domain-containing protein, partial [Promethearchaeota archaeon]